MSIKYPNARQSLCRLSETLDVKDNTDVCRLVSHKAKHKTIKKSMFCGQTLQSAVVIQK